MKMVTILKTRVLVRLTHKEWDTLLAALDSVSDGTDGGAYMDVVRLYEKLSVEAGKEKAKP